jgi:hypothetical protein
MYSKLRSKSRTSRLHFFKCIIFIPWDNDNILYRYVNSSVLYKGDDLLVFICTCDLLELVSKVDLDSSYYDM